MRTYTATIAALALTLAPAAAWALGTTTPPPSGTTTPPSTNPNPDALNAYLTLKGQKQGSINSMKRSVVKKPTVTKQPAAAPAVTKPTATTPASTKN
jgi:hypothetical protein